MELDDDRYSLEDLGPRRLYNAAEMMNDVGRDLAGEVEIAIKDAMRHYADRGYSIRDAGNVIRSVVDTWEAKLLVMQHPLRRK